MKCELCESAEGHMVDYGVLFYMMCNECADRVENMGTTPDVLLSAFSYLDELRESGRTNMLGSSEYLVDEWCPTYEVELNGREAGEFVGFWMETFGTRHAAREG